MTNAHRILLASFSALVGAISVGSPITAQTPEQAADQPHYLANGRLVQPRHYREWVFLSSSIDMSYNDQPVHQFDNVFAPRAAYRAFLKWGVWPDKTVLILENRGASSKGTITRSGQFQDGRVIGLEAHVKDRKRFKDGWGFFVFEGSEPGEFLPFAAACYACHRQHGAADTTFVQFYPTLLPVATRRRTLNPAYVAANVR